MSIQAVAVVGVGWRGSGIAEICAKAGHATIIREADESVLALGCGHPMGPFMLLDADVAKR